MKLGIITMLMICLFSCKNKSREVDLHKMQLADTVTLAPKQHGYYTSVENKTRGLMKVSIDNYTDSVKTFVILVKEK